MAVVTETTARVWLEHDSIVQAPPVTVEQEDVDISDSLSAGWLTTIRAEVFKHTEVEDLYVSIGDDLIVDYWIIIPHRDIGVVRTLIKSQQKNIIGLFATADKPPFQLDFHIIYRAGRASRELVPSDAFRVPQP